MDTQIDVNPKSYDAMILDHIPIGTALLDAKSLRLLRANNLFLALLDKYVTSCWQHGEALDHTLLEFLPRSRLVELFWQVARTGTPFEAKERTFPEVDGGKSFWNWKVKPITDEDEQTQYLLITIREVTVKVEAHQKAEEAYAALSLINRLLNDEHKRLQTVEIVARSVREYLDIDSIGSAALDALTNCFHPIDVCIHIADPVQQALHLLQIRSMAGVSYPLSFLERISYESPLLLAQANKRHEPIVIENAQESLQPQELEHNPYLIGVNIRGFICVPLWFKDHFEGTLAAIFSYPISAHGPELETFLGCSTHIAAALAHARLHTAVKNEQARLQAALNQLPEGIIITESPGGRISYVNSAATYILDTTYEQLLGTSIFEAPLADCLTTPSGQPFPPEQLIVCRALQGESTSGYEIQVRKQNGEKIVLLTSVAPFFAVDGTITGTVGVFQDITERKSLEEQKSNFLSIASHELRTPITVIRGFAEILQMKVQQGISLDAPRSLHAIDGIADQSYRLARLLDAMLDLSRLEKDQLFVNFAPHDLVATLKQFVETQSIITSRNQIRFVLEGLQADDVLLASYDDDRLDQLLNNLLSNAIKYSPQDSEIEIGLRYPCDCPEHALIWVKDVGVGITESELPHIFERFHRAGNLDRSISGLGIGLYLVSEIAKRHGGRVWAQSVAGRGSTFFVQLPLHMVQ